MSELKLDEQDLKNLNDAKGALESFVKSSKIISNLAKERIEIYLISKLKNMGLETEKTAFNVDTKTGTISEVKETNGQQ